MPDPILKFTAKYFQIHLSFQRAQASNYLMSQVFVFVSGRSVRICSVGSLDLLIRIFFYFPFFYLFFSTDRIFQWFFFILSFCSYVCSILTVLCCCPHRRKRCGTRVKWRRWAMTRSGASSGTVQSSRSALTFSIIFILGEITNQSRVQKIRIRSFMISVQEIRIRSFMISVQNIRIRSFMISVQKIRILKIA